MQLTLQRMNVYLLQDNGFVSDYKMIGMHICMGDHKVSWLRLTTNVSPMMMPIVSVTELSFQSACWFYQMAALIWIAFQIFGFTFSLSFFSP